LNLWLQIRLSNSIGLMQFWRSSLKVVPELRNEFGGQKLQEIALWAAAPTPVDYSLSYCDQKASSNVSIDILRCPEKTASFTLFHSSSATL
jgi:hypothetical protein